MKFKKFLYMAIGGVVTLFIAGAIVWFAQPAAAAEYGQPVFGVFDGDQGPAHPRGPRVPGGAGNHLDFLLEEMGITQEEFEAAVEAAREAAITDAVSEGIITQEQADNLLDGRGRGRFNGGADRGGEYLAEALGLSVEELNTALENARQAALDQALAEGNITQEQYDLFQARQALKDYIDRDEIMAGILGVTVEEVAAARDSRTMHELVEDSGLTPEEMRAAAQAAHEAAVAEAVEAGVISAEQAEALESGPHFGGPAGRQRGPRGRGQGNFGPGGSQGQNGGSFGHGSGGNG